MYKEVGVSSAGSGIFSMQVLKVGMSPTSSDIFSIEMVSEKESSNCAGGHSVICSYVNPLALCDPHLIKYHPQIGDLWMMKGTRQALLRKPTDIAR